jgi:hypothetical protein
MGEGLKFSPDSDRSMVTCPLFAEKRKTMKVSILK